jgi:hypothetical protein
MRRLRVPTRLDLRSAMPRHPDRALSRFPLALSLLALLFAVATLGYYLTDSLAGRDTSLGAQLRILGFCPGVTAASTPDREHCPAPLIGGDLLPSADDTFSLGSAQLRWKDLSLGPGTLYLEDRGTGAQVGLSIVDGALLLDGADSLRIGNIRLTTSGLESVLSGADITIGNPGDSGYVLLSTGIKFPDGSTMTSAADLGVAGTGGARGPRGLTGLPGATGLTGAAGLPGRDGIDGSDGVPGARGLTGAPGATGAQGLRGEQGLPGATGATGLRGEQGLPGATGATGATGERGERGLPGADGAPGLRGEQGSIGLTGATGPAGSSILEMQLADGDVAIDLTKQLIVLGAGTWTLADGVDGQILYFVTSTGADVHDIYLIVDHLRYQNGAVSVLGTSISWDPFPHRTGGTNIPLMTMAVFSQGAWSVSAGELR